MKRFHSAAASALVCALVGIDCGRRPLDTGPPADPPLRPTPCDQDGDGYLGGACGGDDCNDADPAVHPDAPDLNAAAGSWTTERVLTVSGGSYAGTAVAADRRGGVHIAYTAGRSLGLLYARRAGRGWQVESVGSPGEPQPDTAAMPRDRKPAIVVDAQGSVHIVYSTSAGIRHAVRAGAVWSTEAVDPDGHGTAAIAIAPDGAIHVAYGASDGLRHATRRAGAWTMDLVDPLGVRPSIAIDATGTLHLAYAIDGEGFDFLRYATGTPGAWRVETASDTLSGAGSIALGRDALPRIAFPSYVTGNEVRVLTRVGAGWASGSLPSSRDVYSTTLRLDGRDRPQILFSQLADVFFAVATGDAWSSERITVLGQNDVEPSLDLDAAATAHVATTGFFYPDNETVEYGSNRQLAPDGVDQNCDGVDGVDADGDGHASLPTGGDDCDDDDPSVGVCSTSTLTSS